MRLYEFESKYLLRERGIVTPKGSVIDTSSGLADIKDEWFPVALKAQVLTGGRMKAGAIAFAADRLAAEGAATKLIGMEVNGHVCHQVLVESRIEVRNEFYLGLTYDTAAKAPVAIFSSAGGIDVEKSGGVTRGLITLLPPASTYRFKEILVEAGVSGRRLASMAAIFTRLAALFIERDCTLAEINPLVEAADGSFVAVDCHIDIDDDALFRHKDLVKKFGLEGRASGSREKTPFEAAAESIDRADHRGVAGRVVEFPGSLGLLIGGGGASLTSFDAVLRFGGQPADYCEIGGNPSVSKVKELTKLILSRPGVQQVAVMMNVVSNTRVDLVARGVIGGILELGLDPAEKIAIFRIPGAWEEDGFAILRKYGVNFVDRTVSIDEAARRAVQTGSR